MIAGGCICVAMARVVVMSIMAFNAGNSSMWAGCEPESRAAFTACVQISCCNLWDRIDSARVGIDIRRLAIRRQPGIQILAEQLAQRRLRGSPATTSIRSHAVPMAFASSATRCRRSSKRDAAPENVKAMSSPRSAKTAPSTVPAPARAPSGSVASRRIPRRRPASIISSSPMNRPPQRSGITVRKFAMIGPGRFLWRYSG